MKTIEHLVAEALDQVTIRTRRTRRDLTLQAPTPLVRQHIHEQLARQAFVSETHILGIPLTRNDRMAPDTFALVYSRRPV